jgi:hypothetical protein
MYSELLEGFHRLFVYIGRCVAGTFSSAKGEDAIRAADIPPTKPALDRRRERLLASALAAPEGTPKRLLLPPRATYDSSRHRIPHWFSEASNRNQLVKEGRACETSAPRTPHGHNPGPVAKYAMLGRTVPSEQQLPSGGSSPEMTKGTDPPSRRATATSAANRPPLTQSWQRSNGQYPGSKSRTKST